jgi:hypothetical protein
MERLKLSPEQFFDGLLAAIRLKTSVIEGEPTSVHRAFFRVLKELPKNSVLEVDLFDVDYDPLYGQSGWFDRALTTAQRDAVVGFSNPSYNKITIKYTSQEGQTILKALAVQPAVDEFERLAGIFTQSLESAQVRRSSF